MRCCRLSPTLYESRWGASKTGNGSRKERFRQDVKILFHPGSALDHQHKAHISKLGKSQPAVYFESTWKCVGNYTIVDFSRVDASSHQLFHAMEDERHFNIKHGFGWKREAGREKNCDFLVTFIGSISYILWQKALLGSHSPLGHFNELRLRCCAWGRRALRCIVSLAPTGVGVPSGLSGFPLVFCFRRPTRPPSLSPATCISLRFPGLCTQEQWRSGLGSPVLGRDLSPCGLDKYLLNELDEWLPKVTFILQSHTWLLHGKVLLFRFLLRYVAHDGLSWKPGGQLSWLCRAPAFPASVKSALSPGAAACTVCSWSFHLTFAFIWRSCCLIAQFSQFTLITKLRFGLDSCL